MEPPGMLYPGALLGMLATLWLSWPLLLAAAVLEVASTALAGRCRAAFVAEAARLRPAPRDFSGVPWRSGAKLRLAVPLLLLLPAAEAANAWAWRVLAVLTFGFLAAEAPPAVSPAPVARVPAATKRVLRVVAEHPTTGVRAPATELLPDYAELVAEGLAPVTAIPPTDLRVAVLRRDFLRAVRPHTAYWQTRVLLPRQVHALEPCASCRVCGTLRS